MHNITFLPPPQMEGKDLIAKLPSASTILEGSTTQWGNSQRSITSLSRLGKVTMKSIKIKLSMFRVITALRLRSHSPKNQITLQTLIFIRRYRERKCFLVIKVGRSPIKARNNLISKITNHHFHSQILTEAAKMGTKE